MKYTFLTTFVQIINFMDGSVYYPKSSNAGYHVGVFFCDKGRVFIDNLVLTPIDQEVDCGIMIRSFISNGRLVSLAEYVSIIIDIIELDYKTKILMCPLTNRFFRIGYRFRRGFDFNMN